MRRSIAHMKALMTLILLTCDQRFYDVIWRHHRYSQFNRFSWKTLVFLCSLGLKLLKSDRINYSSKFERSKPKKIEKNEKIEKFWTHSPQILSNFQNVFGSRIFCRRLPEKLKLFLESPFNALLNDYRFVLDSFWRGLWLPKNLKFLAIFLPKKNFLVKIMWFKIFFYSKNVSTLETYSSQQEKREKKRVRFWPFSPLFTPYL